MKKHPTRYLLLWLLICVGTPSLFGQNSVLVNFGSPTCADPNTPVFAFIKDPLGAAPSLMSTCDMEQQVGNFFGVFVAYNPKDNKIYIASVQGLGETKIWAMDIGLPGSIGCPALIPVAPDNAYNYVSNNFEFDNNGDLWSLSAYDSAAGLCSIDKFDVGNGNVMGTKPLKFPVEHYPTAITSGDLAILPNGRMFATLGSFPSVLYEITDYNAGDTARAVYLQTMPLSCYGIAYLNGQLEITGTDLSSTCYYYDYNISTNELGAFKVFQNGMGPIDNTSLTPALGTTKRLVSAEKINSNTADLVYEVYVRNMGNVILNNINLTDDLAATFGEGNVSNVTVSFVDGFNVGGLTINPAFNGTTETQVLNQEQQLPNNTSKNLDYFFKVQIKCRVTNLENNITYLNSAIGTALINNDVDPINVSDSSNNGPENVIDPDNDGNAGGPGENVPTPFNISSLPVHFINIAASFINKTSTNVQWTVATPTVNASHFDVEFSADAHNWKPLGKVSIVNANQGKYQFVHNGIPNANLYYRIKQTDKDGQFIYSSVVLLQNQKGETRYRIYPNPSKNYLSISTPYNISGSSVIEMYDATGRKQMQVTMNANAGTINTAALPNGYYQLKITHGNDIQTEKVLIMH